MFDIDIKAIVAQIKKSQKPKKVKWFCIGMKNGRKVWMTESALRRATVDEICSDKSLSPAPRWMRLRRGLRR